MSSVAESIARIIEVARRLRAAADELGNLELKSRILDEISTLQELRDQCSLSSDSVPAGVAAAVAGQNHQPARSVHEGSRSATILGDRSMAVIQPTGDSGTYSLKAEEPPPLPAPVPAESADEAAAGGKAASAKAAPAKTADKAGTAKPAAGATKAGSAAGARVTGAAAAGPSATESMTPEQRAALAEMRIAELEPLQHAVVKQINDILTPEQKKLKAQVSKAGRDAGKTGRELQQFILAGLNLSDDQKARMNAARKELQAIRTRIAAEVEFLLDDDQRRQVLHQSGSAEDGGH